VSRGLVLTPDRLPLFSFQNSAREPQFRPEAHFLSKAFTKDEGEGTDSAEVDIDPLAGLPEGAKNYMTQAGYDGLRGELRRLSATSGEENVRRVRYLERVLESAEVVPSQNNPDRVLFGTRVRVADENGNEHFYQIVGLNEADAKVGKISWTSPLAKALLNKKVGEAALFRSPAAGEQELEILEITG
jgi:transcription elongation factor GreB